MYEWIIFVSTRKRKWNNLFLLYSFPVNILTQRDIIVTFCWSLGNVGIEENEVVGRKAKVAIYNEEAFSCSGFYKYRKTNF